MQPYNHQLVQLDPMGSALKGMEAGRVLNQAGMQQQQQQQLFQQNQELFEQKKIKFEQDQEDRLQSAISSAAIKAKLDNLSENYSKENVVKFAIKNPAYFEPMMKLTENMDAEQEKRLVKKAFQMESLAEQSPEGYIAERTLEFETLLKSKDPKLVAEGRRIEYLVKAAQKNLDAGKLDAIVTAASLNSIGLVGPEKYAKLMAARGKYKSDIATAAKTQKDVDYYDKVTESKLKNEKALTDKTQKEADFYGDEFALDAEKVANESQKILNDAKRMQMENDGVLPPEKKIDIELRLRNQYWKEGGEKYELVNRAYNTIKDASKSGIGSLTTVLSYMKAIDPGSTVTGNEVITAQDAPGLSAKMINIVNKVFAEGEMGETAREQFLKEAENLRNTAKKMADKPRARITSQAKGYGLNIGNIFTVNAKSKIKDRLREKMKTK
jgi:hypothetical protein